MLVFFANSHARPSVLTSRYFWRRALKSFERMSGFSLAMIVLLDDVLAEVVEFVEGEFGGL
jgi:hypothetical protein